MNTKKATGVITNNYTLQDRLSTVVLNKIIEAILYLEDKAQDNYDANLATQAKTILGAINEIANEAATMADIPKMVTLSQTDYDDLVNAGTVDSDTYYFIEEE